MVIILVFNVYSFSLHPGCKRLVLKIIRYISLLNKNHNLLLFCSKSFVLPITVYIFNAKVVYCSFPDKVRSFTFLQTAMYFTLTYETLNPLARVNTVSFGYKNLCLYLILKK